MAKISVFTVLEGIADFQRTIELTDEGTRKRTIEVVRNGAQAISDGAEQRAPKRSGELKESIRPEFHKSGMTAWVKAGYGILVRSIASKGMGAKSRARAIARRDKMRERFKNAVTSRRALAALELGVYAPVLEKGDKRRNKPQRPFLYPAFKQEKPAIIDGLKKAPLDAAKSAGLSQ